MTTNRRLTVLTPDVFEAIVTALAETLASVYRARWDASGVTGSQGSPSGSSGVSPWLTVKEAAERARCGVKILYH